MSYAPQSALDYLTSWVNTQFKALNNDIDNVIMPQLLGVQKSINALNSSLSDNWNRTNEATRINIQQQNDLEQVAIDMRTVNARTEQNAANIAELARLMNVDITTRPKPGSGLSGILGSLGLGLGIGTGTLIVGGIAALLLLRGK